MFFGFLWFGRQFGANSHFYVESVQDIYAIILDNVLVVVVPVRILP